MMWLLKTEPTAYSWDCLVRDGRTVWDGVTNPQAVSHLRTMRAGDRAFVYHTGKEKAVVGLAEVVAPGPLIEIRPLHRLERPVSLAELKILPVFASSPLVRQGRLSVVPLTAAQVRAIEARDRR